MQPMPLSTIIGLGLIVGAAVLWWTGVPEVAIAAAGLVKAILPEHEPNRTCNYKNSPD